MTEPRPVAGERAGTSVPSFVAMRRMCRSPGGVLALALLGANVGNLLFHLVAVRGLGTVGYGELGALLGVLTALTVPISALQTVVAGKVSRARERGEVVDPWPSLRGTARYAVLAAAVAAAASPLLGMYARSTNPWPGLMLALYLLPATLCIVPWGYLYGTGAARRIAVAIVLGAVFRVGVGSALTAAGYGVTGAMAATLAADCVQVAVLLLATVDATGRGVARGTTPTAPLPTTLTLTTPEALRGSLAVAGMWALLGIDVLTARHLLDATQAGLYATAALAAKSVLFLAQILATVLIRRLASRSGATARAALSAGLLAATTVGLAATLTLVLIGDPLLHAVAGGGPVADAATRAMLGLAVTALSLLGLVVQALLARGPHRAWPTWSGPVVFLLGTTTFRPDTALGIAAALALSATVALAACFLDAMRATPDPTRTPKIPAPAREFEAKPETKSEAKSEADAAPPRPPGQLDLSIVIPYYNPGPALAATVRQTVCVLTAHGVEFEVIAVSDGSTDGSSALLPAPARHFRRIELPVNRGKGAALRAGFAHARGAYVGFIDADGDLDPALLPGMYDAARGFALDAVVGAKHHNCSVGNAGGPRHLRGLGSRVFRRLARALFRLPVADTQTGIKIFRAEALAAALPYSREPRFVIDLELLALMHRQGARRVMEAPVRFRARSGSTVDAAAVTVMIRDVLTLRARMFATPKAAADVLSGPPAKPLPARAVPAQRARAAAALLTPLTRGLTLHAGAR